MRTRFPRARPYRDRHGKRRWRYRHKGKSAELGTIYGSEEFIQRYQAAEASLSAGASKTRPGTLSALAAAFYRSQHYTSLKPSTQAVYRGIIERLREQHGSKRITEGHLRRKHVLAMMAEKAETPHAANRLRSILNLLMQLAIDMEWRETNPVLTVKKYKAPEGGHYTWTEADISRFMEVHEAGTVARRAMILLLYTAAARSDAVKLGRQNIKNGKIEYYRQKQEGRGALRISVPILPPLQKVINETPPGQLTFLQARHGRTRSAQGLGNAMRKWCDQAGLPECTSHGLRKAQGRRLSEAGCTTKQIMAWLGHATLTESDRYTRDADVDRLTDAAGERLEGAESEQNVVNHPRRFTR